MKKPSISFFIMCFVLLFAVIGFIFVVFDLHKLAFVLELMLLLIFTSLLAFAMFIICHNKKLGWTIIGATLILLLLDIFFIFLLTKTFETEHITTILFSVIGLVVTLVNLIGTKQPVETEIEEKYEKVNDYYPYIDKVEPKEKPEVEPKIEKTFTPGKFIASKKANKFHSPKCDWAKKIGKSNQLWFNSKEEAETQGFEADKCVS